jgi:steroid Delta-isomerase
MPDDETAAREHVARFNAAVLSGDWPAFIATFHPDAVMDFIGPPAGPFHGRAAIADAYAANPPGDTMTIRGVTHDGPTEIVTFAWSRGGTGTMAIRRTDGLITSLIVTFD